MTPTRALMLAGILLPLLGGCSQSAPDSAPVENDMAPAADTTVPTPEPLAPPTAAIAPAVPPSDANAVDAAEPEAPTPPDEQMLDDASATGMTARASRDDPGDAPANEEVEQK